MGLNTTHGAWDGAYSSFMSWRIWVAEQVGIDLTSMKGFNGENEWTNEMKKDPLYALLYHSDCDGDLKPEECKGIAERLQSILLDFKGDKMIDEYFIDKTETFIEGCLLASSQNEAIEFY